MEPLNKPLEVESLITEDQRRTVSVAGHREFRESLSVPAHAYDEIDHSIADFKPAQRRKESEVSKLDQLLDDILVEQLRSKAYEESAVREDGSND